MSVKILDPCCGSRMFWFDREHPAAVFGDIRRESITLCDGRTLTVSPDAPMDFRQLPFADGSFKLVVFDPPHLKRAGEFSWLRAKYGALSPDTWRDDIRQGFAECFRVLQPDGVLIFKWNEIQIKTLEILKLTDQKPLFGHPSGKRSNTHWICFMRSAA
jgi:SAM-dependent methyltransferase